MNWEADIRVGIATVHAKDKIMFNCLDGMRDQCIYWANGYEVLKPNNDFDHWEVSPEKIANAHLIAAAPDMYQALKAARISMLGDEDYQKFKPVLETIDKALAKAEGK
jgi:hypothetical protein